MFFRNFIEFPHSASSSSRKHDHRPEITTFGTSDYMYNFAELLVATGDLKISIKPSDDLTKLRKTRASDDSTWIIAKKNNSF